jgi:uncharacterized protein YacL
MVGAAKGRLQLSYPALGGDLQLTRPRAVMSKILDTSRIIDGRNCGTFARRDF